MQHELKTDPEHFQEVKSGNKTAELRRLNDRCFEVGDIIYLREFDRETGKYSGDTWIGWITHVLKDFEGLAPGWVMLSMKPFN